MLYVLLDIDRLKLKDQLIQKLLVNFLFFVILLHFLSFTVCNMSLSISLLVFNVHCESKKHATVVLYLPIFNNSVTV